MPSSLNCPPVNHCIGLFHGQKIILLRHWEPSQNWEGPLVYEFKELGNCWLEETHDVEFKGWSTRSKYQLHRRQSNCILEGSEWSGILGWSLDTKFGKGKTVKTRVSKQWCLNCGMLQSCLVKHSEACCLSLSCSPTHYWFQFCVFGVEPRLQEL